MTKITCSVDAAFPSESESDGLNLCLRGLWKRLQF